MGRTRFPRFKRKYDEQASYPCSGNLAVRDQSVSLSKVAAPTQAVVHRPIGGDIKSITVIRTASGKYFASILNEDEVATPVPVAILSEDEVLRADAGLANLLTESRGRKTNNPRFLKRAQRNLRRNQKALSRKKKGSKNREGSVEDCQGA
ncbi:hypothetical protein BB934_27675 (plasmid) [Microvirga ossetica]|uniref:Probable transposase IS891/IS1136/IS1341 domain-containing protein n=1 Tax=Microvirga ossetica TaxID=1882682 RepID=A0A1B2EQ97_9HYPH|nr:hypothetical protein BB934_27675 [Microvirga ossetica]